MKTPTKIDRSHYQFFTKGNTMPWGEHFRLVHALCDAYDKLASDPRLWLVATAERPEGVDAVRICKYRGEHHVEEYSKDGGHTYDGSVYTESRWITLAAIHAAFPFTPPPDPRISELAALKAKVAALEAEIGGAS